MSLKISTRYGSDSDRGRRQEYTAEGLNIKAHYYPMCCTANVLTGFGESENEWDSCQNDQGLQDKVNEIKAWIGYWSDKSQGILTTITTNEQETGNAALEACGFIRSEPIMNVKYPRTFLYNWYLPLNGFVKNELDDRGCFKCAG